MRHAEKPTRLHLRVRHLGTFFVLACLAVLWAYPVANALVESLKLHGLANYAAVINYPTVHYFTVIANSLFIAVATSLAVTFVATLAAYAFSKMEFRGRGFVYLALLACLAVPPAAVMTPLFFTIKIARLMDTYASIILPLVAFNAPFMLMILKNYFDTIPNSLLEAARIDGASRLKIYTRIVLPLGVPAIVNVLVLTFIYSWNDFLMPLLFVRKESMYTVTLATSFFTATKNQTPEMVAQLYAALILMTIPSIVIYIASQKYFQEGLTAGAIKQ
jgi:raffinose/stachyose/melibiose transport system permease protein